MAESFEHASEFIGKHKTALGLAAGAVVLWLLLRGGGSSGGGASSSDAANLQIAQLQAAQNVQNAQLQSQQNVAALSAQVQQNQNNAALEATQDQLATQLAETAYAANTQNTQTNAQAAIYKELIDTGAQEQEAQLGVQSTLGSQLIAKDTGHSGQQQAAVNEFGVLFGQGNVGSYNEGTASQGIASTLETGSIISSLTKTAGGVLGALF